MFKLPQETIEEFKSFIENHNFFFIAGHKEPDGDCITSCLGIAAMPAHLKETRLCAGRKSFLIQWNFRMKTKESLAACL